MWKHLLSIYFSIPHLLKCLIYFGRYLYLVVAKALLVLQLPLRDIQVLGISQKCVDPNLVSTAYQHTSLLCFSTGFAYGPKLDQVVSVITQYSHCEQVSPKYNMENDI